MDVFRDFKITNISFAEEPKAGSKTLVKVHHVRMPGFDDDQDDSDDEDESEKDDEDDEEDSEKVYTLCSLSAGKVEQVTVDLQFCEEELVGFSITGNTPVDLVGNYVAGPDHYDQEPSSDEMYSQDEDDEFSDEEAYRALMEEDSEMDTDDDEEEDPSRFEELIQPKVKKAIEATPKQSKKAVEAAPTPSKKRSADAPASEGTPTTKQLQKKLKADIGTPTASPAQASATPSKVVESKVEKQTKAAKDAIPKTEVTEKKSVEKPGSKMTTTKLASGLIIEEKTAGTGPAAKAGQKVGMRYVGKLSNGKVFDQCTSGKPFSFKLGKGEVIKGWDEGVKGMRVGAERRLTCPPKLAYGSQKLPGIPANSTLIFDVKLVEIK